MNETKVSDERVREIAASPIGIHITDAAQSMARELLAHRASRPLEQAALLKAREALTHVAFRGPPQLWSRDWSFNPTCPSCHAADGGSKKFIHGHGCKLEAAIKVIAAALDAAAKQAGGGENESSSGGRVERHRTVNPADTSPRRVDSLPTAPSPAPSSPPREDAMTPEQRANKVTGVVGSALSMGQQITLAAKVIEQVRAAVAAEGARKDALLRESAQRESFWRSEFDSRKAELAKLNRKVSWLLGTLEQERARLKPAQPAAGGEAEKDARFTLEQMLGCAMSARHARDTVDALDAYLDARSSARAGG